MRISDWSSDVCSSDLIMTSWRPNCRQASSRAMTGWRCSYEHGRRCGDIVVRHGVHAGAERAGRAATADARLAEDGARMGRNLRAAVSGDPGLSARRGIRGGLAPTFYLNLT